MLIFENNYNRWMSMAVNDQWTSSSIKPIYTSGGNVNQTPKSARKSNTAKQTPNGSKKTTRDNTAAPDEDNTPSTSKFQGWSVEGLNRFNELYDFIDKERKSDVGINFENKFVRYCLVARDNKMLKKSKKKCSLCGLKA